MPKIVIKKKLQYVTPRLQKIWETERNIYNSSKDNIRSKDV